MMRCLFCYKEITNRRLKFCNNQCQADLRYKQYLTKWQKGLLDGNRGVVKKNISAHIKRFLLEKYGKKCSNCGWNKKHPITLRSPLEIDHIDGNADNNKESNLRILCPNCHSLTVNFRNLNKGKGRKWR